MSDEDATSKPNRRAKQEPKAHRQVMSKPMGLPKWDRSKGRKERDRTIADVSKRARKSQATYGLERFAKDMGPMHDDSPNCTLCGHEESAHQYRGDTQYCYRCSSGGNEDNSEHEFHHPDFGPLRVRGAPSSEEKPKTATGPSETPAPIPSKVPKTWAHLVSQKRYIPPHIADRAKVEQSPRSKEISHRAAVALKLRHQFHGTATDKMGKSDGDVCGCGHGRSDHQMITSNDDPTPRIRCRSCYDDHPFSPDTVPLHVQRRNEEAASQREFVPKTRRVDTIMGLHEKYRGSGHSVMDKSGGDKRPLATGRHKFDYANNVCVTCHGKERHQWDYQKRRCATCGMKEQDLGGTCYMCQDYPEEMHPHRYGPKEHVPVPDQLPKTIRNMKSQAVFKSDAMFEMLDDKSPRYHGHEDPIGGKWVHQHDGGDNEHGHSVPRIKPNCCDRPAQDHWGGFGAAADFRDGHALTGERLMVRTTRHSATGFKDEMVPDKLPDDIQHMKSQATFNSQRPKPR